MKILRGPWNEDLFRVLEGFPDLAHDDEVDACSGALEMLNPDMKGYGAFEAARQRAEELLAEQQRNKPQPTQPTWAPGSMEWLAEQNKSSSTAAPAPSVCTSPRGPRAWRDSSAHPNRGTEGSRPSPPSPLDFDITRLFLFCSGSQRTQP